MRPAMCRRSTVFPEPLPPMTTSVSPLKASKDRPRRTSTLSKRFQTSLTSTIAVIRFSSRRPSPLGSLGSQYHFEPFHRSARRPTRLTSHGHSNHFTARLAARRGSPRTATRTISPLGSPPDAAHLARPLEPFHRSARRPTRLTSHGPARPLLAPEEDEKQLGEEEVGHDHTHRDVNDRGRRRPPQPFRASLDAEAVVAADQRDDAPEEEALAHAHEKVARHHPVGRHVPVGVHVRAALLG